MIYLDAGHGSMIGGHYDTAPEKMFPPSGTSNTEFIYEGEFNHAVVARIAERLTLFKHIPYYHVSPEHRDVTLETRVRRANTHYIDHGKPRSIFLSIHANASGPGITSFSPRNGQGAEVYTYPIQNEADLYADILIKKIERTETIRRDRSDGDDDKEEPFYVLRKTLMPAVLIECAFMDHRSDFIKLRDPSWRDTMAMHITEGLTTIYRTYLNFTT